MKPGTSENLFQYMARLTTAGTDPTQKEQEIWHRYGQTLAILILDSSGFSRVTKSHGIIHFLSRLMQVRELTKSVFEAHECQRLHFESDNIFAAFSHVDNAINCAFEVHRTIHQAEIMLTESERFSVCIGIGYGKMLYSETMEGYFSEEMNFASKLGEDTANSHETLVTENAFGAMSNSLQKEFSPMSVQISGLNLPSYRHYYTF